VVVDGADSVRKRLKRLIQKPDFVNENRSPTRLRGGGVLAFELVRGLARELSSHLRWDLCAELERWVELGKSLLDFSDALAAEVLGPEEFRLGTFNQLVDVLDASVLQAVGGAYGELKLVDALHQVSRVGFLRDVQLVDQAGQVGGAVLIDETRQSFALGVEVSEHGMCRA